MSEEKKTPAKKTAKKTTAKAPAKKTTAKAPAKKTTAKAPAKKTTAKAPVEVSKPVEVVEEPKVEIIRDVATSKPLNIIQPNINKEVVEELKGSKAKDSKSGEPHWLVKFFTLNFIFGWWK